MRVAVVGNGPSARGKGREIDACDFVVRLKAFWLYGAEDAGRRVDAICWYGVDDGWDNPPVIKEAEIWITQEPRLFRGDCEGQSGPDRLERIVNLANLGRIRWMPTESFCRSDAYIGRSPTTGFTAVNMAIHIHRPDEIHLFGFDATTRDRPNYDDARRKIPLWVDDYHNMEREKWVISELFNGHWLGEPCTTRLTWHDMPEVLDV